MTWVLAAAITWLVVAVLIGVLVGRGIRLADARDARTSAAEAASPNFVVDPASPPSGPDDAPSAAPLGSRTPAPRPSAEHASFPQPGAA